MFENNEKIVKETSAIEIDLRKGENRKLTFVGYKGKVALSIILIIWVSLGFLLGIILGITNDMILVSASFGVALIVFDIVTSIILSKFRKDHKRRYILKSDTLDGIVDYLECPNYEEKVRLEDKKITFESVQEDVDYYDEYEEEEESTTYVQAFDEIDFDEKVIEIIDFAKSKGLSTDALSVRLFLSAINSSHLIELKSPDLEVSKKFIDVMTEYLGRKAYYAKENPSWNEPSDTLWKKQNNQLVESEVLKSILSASKNKNTFTFLGLVDVNYARLDEYFNQMLTFVNFPNLRLLLDVSAKFNNGVDPAGKVAIPKNLWFIILPRKEENNLISEKTCRNIVSIEVNGNIIEPSNIDAEANNILIDQFEYSVNKAMDQFVIEEELWKKYDEFISKVNEIVNLNLNDKYFYGIENFALMYASTGAMVSSAIDNVINSKILPLILNMKKLEVDEIDSIINLIDTIFETEGFTVTLKTLNKLKEN